MNSRDILLLAVRLLGLIFLYLALESLPMELVLMFQAGFSAMLGIVATIAWQLVVAYWLLRGAPALMRIAYPAAEPGSK